MFAKITLQQVDWFQNNDIDIAPHSCIYTTMGVRDAKNKAKNFGDTFLRIFFEIANVLSTKIT